MTKLWSNSRLGTSAGARVQPLDLQTHFAINKFMGLNTVELVLAFEASFGISITKADAESIFTTRQITERIYDRVRSNIKPDAKITELLPSRHRRDLLNSVAERAGLRPLKRLPFSLHFTFGWVRDVVIDAVIGQNEVLRLPGYGWSRAQVREVVRSIMFTQLALRKFSVDARLVKDLVL